MLETKKKFDYKWIILALCFMMVFVTLGFCSSNKSLYLGKITETLDIERSAFSINDSCRFISQAIINLFFGAIFHKLGAKKMIAVGFTFLILSMLTYANADAIYTFIYQTVYHQKPAFESIKNSVYIFYAGGIMLGIGLSLTSTTVASSLVRRWFTKNIGTYTSIVFAANGLGGALAAQIVSPMINSGPYGYKRAYSFVAVLLVAIGILLVVFLKEQPKDAPVVAISTKKKARGVSWIGMDSKTALRQPFFYITAAVVLLTGFSLQGINGIWSTHMEDVGISDTFTKNLATFYSIFLTFTKLIVGALYDRKGLRRVMLICQGAGVIAFIALAITADTLIGKTAAVSFAILYALALPLETLVVPLIANDLFGSAAYDKLLGILLAMNYSGYAMGGPVVNLFYQHFGDYKQILTILSILTVILLVSFQFVISAANRKKAQILAEANSQPEKL